jgi:hypothetical protein
LTAAYIVWPVAEEATHVEKHTRLSLKNESKMILSGGGGG